MVFVLLSFRLAWNPSPLSSFQFLQFLPYPMLVPLLYFGGTYLIQRVHSWWGILLQDESYLDLHTYLGETLAFRVDARTRWDFCSCWDEMSATACQKDMNGGGLQGQNVMDSMFAPHPQFTCWSPNLSCNHIWRWGLWRFRWDHESGVPNMRLLSL